MEMLQSYPHNYVWGAGAKGVSFVNILDPDGQYIDALVDINKDKHGRYSPLSAHVVISPEEFLKRPNGCVYIMNGNYKEEILPYCKNHRVIVLGGK